MSHPSYSQGGGACFSVCISFLMAEADRGLVADCATDVAAVFGAPQRVIGWATEQACVMVYLHVITYNHNAIAFYQRNAFTEVALLPNFYFIG